MEFKEEDWVGGGDWASSSRDGCDPLLKGEDSLYLLRTYSSGFHRFDRFHRNEIPVSC